MGVEWSRFGGEVKTVTCSALQKLINTVYTFLLFFFCVFEGYTSYRLDDNYPRGTESHHHQAYAEITYVYTSTTGGRFPHPQVANGGGSMGPIAERTKAQPTKG